MYHDVSRVQAAFKPGTSTWNTDDPEQQPWLARAAKKQRRNGLDTVGAAPAPDAGPAPLPYTSSAKLVQRLQTTGARLLLQLLICDRFMTMSELMPNRSKDSDVMMRLFSIQAELQ
jgi:hypothetical protein